LNSEDNLQLFDSEDIDDGIKNELDIVRLDFQDYFSADWKSLFSGFDNLYTITYSSQIDFVWKVVSLFTYCEIIFGNEVAIGNNMSDVISFQHEAVNQIDRMKKDSKKELIERTIKGTLKLWVAKERLSHEKIYLLSSNDGRYRVITGSANMSYSAFLGRQKETINLIEGRAAYNYYFEQFEILKQQSTNHIDPFKLRKLNGNIFENIDNLPITEEINTKKVIEFIDDKSNDQQSEFSFSVINNSKKLKLFIPTEKERNITKISLQNLHIGLKRFQSAMMSNSGNVSKVIPELIIDIDNKSVTLVGKTLDLNPSREDILNDINLFFSYMSGFDTFHGDEGEVTIAKERYYAFANWFFVSPFLSSMRMIAHRQNKKPDSYPVFGLIYGNSKAGKTSFLSTLLHFMIKQEPKLTAQDFTSKSVNDIRMVAKGIPVIFDDMVSIRFNNHAAEVIKNDNFGYNEGLSNFPVVVISANEDVKVVTGDITRRTICCRVNIGLDTTEAMKSNSVRRIQRGITTALYRYYLGKMLQNLDAFINPMFDPEVDQSVDILEYSSKILFDIFSEFQSIKLPNYIQKLKIDDYFDEKITSTYAKKTISNAWKFNRDHFEIDVKRNILKFNSEDLHEINRIRKEIPDSLNPRASNKALIMHLDKAKDFFEIDFRKKGLFNFK